MDGRDSVYLEKIAFLEADNIRLRDALQSVRSFAHGILDYNDNAGDGSLIFPELDEIIGQALSTKTK